MRDDWTVREARASDIPALVSLRRVLFEAMGYRDPDLLAQLEGVSARYFRRALPKGEFRAWVAEIDGEVVATGGLVIHSLPPTAYNLASREGYIMNMYTLPAWRHRGIGGAILRTILDFLKSEGVPHASLHATADGDRLYRREGFRETNEMRLRLDSEPEKGAERRTMGDSSGCYFDRPIHCGDGDREEGRGSCEVNSILGRPVAERRAREVTP